MRKTNYGAVRPFVTAAVLVSFATASFGQVVEKARTLADLIASHPCNSGLAERITRVIDCDAADDIGDGGGAFQCWARCDGSAPWENISIGGGSGGSGDVVGPASATDNAIAAFDTTTGKLLQNRAITISDVAGFIVTLASTPGNALALVATAPTATTGASQAGKAASLTASAAVASTDTAGAAAGGNVNITAGAAARNTSGNANGGNINLTPGAGIGTGVNGSVLLGLDGTATAPALSFAGSPDTGIFGHPTGSYLQFSINGTARGYFTDAGLLVLSTSSGVIGEGGLFYGLRNQVEANTAGVGSPNILNVAADLRVVFTNEGVTAKNYHTLPTAAAGYPYTFCVQDADGLRITANTPDTIRVIDKVTAAAGYIESTTIGSCVTLTAINAVEWFATSITGSWTDGTFTYDDTSLTTP